MGLGDRVRGILYLVSHRKWDCLCLCCGNLHKRHSCRCIVGMWPTYAKPSRTMHMPCFSSLVPCGCGVCMAHHAHVRNRTHAAYADLGLFQLRWQCTLQTLQHPTCPCFTPPSTCQHSTRHNHFKTTPSA